MKKDSLTQISQKLRDAEKEVTKGLIKWKLKQQGQPEPEETVLDAGSQKLVEEAHRVVKKTGKGLLSEFKKARHEFLKAYRDEDPKKE